MQAGSDSLRDLAAEKMAPDVEKTEVDEAPKDSVRIIKMSVGSGSRSYSIILHTCFMS